MYNKKIKLYFLCGYAFFILLFFLSIIYIINYFKLKQEDLEERNLLNSYVIEDRTNSCEEEKTQNVKEEVILEKTDRMLKVEDLKKINTDIIGWLEIPNTKINYPVLQGKDNEYYMTHNYKKEKSKNGAIFLNKDYNFEIPSNNLLIYGHNMNNGTMFQELLKYSDKKFYEEHPKIRFTTIDDDSEYEIIAVFKSRVYYKSEKGVFRYYFFINSESEDEYNKFIENAKRDSLYEIPQTAKFGDELITLSTCSYHVEDGRFAVVGRKIKD